MSTINPKRHQHGQAKPSRPHLITADLGKYHYEALCRVIDVLRSKSAARELINKTDGLRYCIQSAALALGVAKPEDGSQ